jgi:hypothetical protein
LFFRFDFLDGALVSSIFRVLARKIEILMQCQQMYLLRLQGMSNRLFFLCDLQGLKETIAYVTRKVQSGWNKRTHYFDKLICFQMDSV